MTDHIDIVSELEGLAPEFEKTLAQANTMEALEAARVEILGRKGKIARIMSEMPKLAPDKRPAAGQAANSAKEKCAALFEARKQELEAAEEQAKLARFDPSMPGRQFWKGSLHPVTIVTEQLCSIFTRMGYEIASGPEVEIDRYNFEALNMPPEHPARDMQDTLYITDKILLRTHTSPVQVRTMLSRKPPLAIVAPGKVYRRDSDLTHSPMFHQVEGLMVGKNLSMADLRGTLLAMVREMFGKTTSIRFRPSFFPFTEPSAEVDISCVICGGSGQLQNEQCRVCKGTGWVEILGCGMVDPAVYAAVGYPSDISGFAFGLGVERIAMLKFGINDLRVFFQNDLRFLRQFSRWC